MFKNLWKDRRGVTAAEVVLLVISFVVAAYLIPIGMTAILAANTTAWNAGVTAKEFQDSAEFSPSFYLS